MSASSALAVPYDVVPHASAGRRGTHVGVHSTVVEATAAPPLFSPIELLVIGIGRGDRSTSVKQGSGVARLQRLLFGIEHPTPFADARLEALRSLVISLRRHDRSQAAIAIALAAGVTEQQIAHLGSSR